MAGETYAALLQDPRWQKLRLEIFQRDGWRCTGEIRVEGTAMRCRNGLDDGVSLHVHHLKYTADFPWLEPPVNLVTFCESCHARAHGALPLEEYRARLGVWIQKFDKLNQEAVWLLREARELQINGGGK